MNNEIIVEKKIILIRINKLYHETMTEEELYEATRGVWKVGAQRDEADYAFTVANGDIKEIYKIHSWKPAGTQQYNTRPKSDVDIEGRWEFDGSLAEEPIRKQYIGKSAKEFLPHGAANPIIYIKLLIKCIKSTFLLIK